MTTSTSRRVVLAAALTAVIGSSGLVLAQDQVEIIRYPAPVVRVGQDLLLRAGDEVRHGVVVAGSARIEGRVRGDLFVWLGDARLSSTAVVDGALVVIFGNIVIEPGAIVDDELVVVGGTITRPETFMPGREQVIVGFPEIGEGVRALVPWVTQGLLLGRPLVPGLGWMWTLIGITLAVGLVLTLVFHGPVRSAATVVVERPLSVLLTGVLVLLLAGPLLLIVSVTVVGIVVLPVVLCALFVAWTIGKVGVARGIGHRIVHQSDGDSRPQSVRSFLIGFVVITAAYMVPVLGFVTWSLVAVFGLGAALITMTSALRREYPPKERNGRKKGAPAAPTMPASVGAASFVATEPEPAADVVIDTPYEAPEPPPPPPPPPPRPATGATHGLLAYPRAGFLDRAAGFALDCVLLALATALFNLDDEWQLLLVASYFIGFWAWQGTTLGGIIVGLRVVRTSGEPLRFVDSFIRALSSLFSFGVLAIGVLWMIQDPERQTWHDKIAGTYVLKVPRDLPLSS